MKRMKVLITVLCVMTLGAIGTLNGQADVNTPHSQDNLPTIGSFVTPTVDLFNAFPNPNTSDLLSIELEHEYVGVLKVQVYDVYGRLYYNKTIDKFDEYLEFDINASGWTPGMYVVALIGSDVCGSQRVLKE